ncbi:transposase [Streptomyces sp. NPDC004728]|uniref:transposase n=1 Tax=Streptomyces sp. NPDC004728 TaxID=3154289 RepID=UPI0033B3A50B
MDVMPEVDCWKPELESAFARVAGRFGRADLRWRMRDYVRGLLAPVGRKNGWQLAEWAGHRDPAGLQHLLNGARWDADAVRDDVRDYAAERLGPGGVLIIDDTGFVARSDPARHTSPWCTTSTPAAWCSRQLTVTWRRNAWTTPPMHTTRPATSPESPPPAARTPRSPWTPSASPPTCWAGSPRPGQRRPNALPPVRPRLRSEAPTRTGRATVTTSSATAPARPTTPPTLPARISPPTTPSPLPVPSAPTRSSRPRSPVTPATAAPPLSSTTTTATPPSAPPAQMSRT